MLALVNGRVLQGHDFADGLAVLVEGARVAALVPAADIPTTADRRDLAGAMLVPGLIDVQVNGGGDALFNDDPSVATIRRIGAAHARFGTTGFLPTLISDDLDVIRAGIAAVDAALADRAPGVLGIHIEGPFINVERKGIHAAHKIRALDDEGLRVLTTPGRGRRLVTLAPELVEPAAVAGLVAAGITVSAGHTAGSYAEIRAAIDAGLSGVTHLFNAMSPLQGRAPGAVGAALSADDVWCSLIVDGFHVDPVSLKLALRCKPIERFLLVSDAMPPTGGEREHFTLNGRLIRREGGRLLDEDGTLAGADLDMLAAVRNTHQMLGVPVAQAFAMASAHPARFMGLDAEFGTIAPGRRASLIAVDTDWTLRGCWIDGVPQD